MNSIHLTSVGTILFRNVYVMFTELNSQGIFLLLCVWQQRFNYYIKNRIDNQYYVNVFGIFKKNLLFLSTANCQINTGFTGCTGDGSNMIQNLFDLCVPKCCILAYSISLLLSKCGQLSNKLITYTLSSTHTVSSLKQIR